jgi:hypothetical protein
MSGVGDECHSSPTFYNGTTTRPKNICLLSGYSAGLTVQYTKVPEVSLRYNRSEDYRELLGSHGVLEWGMGSSGLAWLFSRCAKEYAMEFMYRRWLTSRRNKSFFCFDLEQIVCMLTVCSKLRNHNAVFQLLDHRCYEQFTICTKQKSLHTSMCASIPVCILWMHSVKSLERRVWCVLDELIYIEYMRTWSTSGPLQVTNMFIIDA